jgi:diguanylate cyclase
MPGISPYSGEYIEQAIEAKYRAEHLPVYVRHVRLCFWCAAILNVFFLASDWRYYGQAHFYFAISARAVIIVTSLACFAAITKAGSFRRLQFMCTTWACPVIAACAALVSPHTDIALFVIFALPPLFYLIFPVSFRRALFFGLSSSVSTLAAYLSPHFFSKTSLGLMLGMLLSNVILVLVLSQSNRLRRIEWTATQVERATNKELSERRNMLQNILKAIPTPLIITAKDNGKLIQINDAAREYFGADLQQSSFKIEDHIGYHDWDKLAMRLRLDAQVKEFETQILLPNGSTRDVLLEATVMEINGTEAILTVLVDITSRKELEATMERMAHTDPLSGLPNRARFFAFAVNEIKRAERYNRSLAVFMVDIDYFKRINDSYGHKTGDLALKAFAKLCQSLLRCQDMVARLGGDEFGFLLPETDESRAMGLADRLIKAVQDLHIDGLSGPITISIGVSEVLHGEATLDAALSRADQALYVAKREGRNREVLYSNVNPAFKSTRRGQSNS